MVGTTWWKKEMSCMACWLADWLLDWLFQWLIGHWLIDWLISKDWLIDYLGILIDWKIDWLATIDLFIDWFRWWCLSIDWFNDWVSEWVICLFTLLPQWPTSINCVVSPDSITLESNINVMRIEKMFADSRSS